MVCGLICDGSLSLRARLWPFSQVESTSVHSAVQNRSLNKVCLLVRSYSTISISEGSAEDETA